MTGVQFGVAGLESTIVCMLRKEKFKSFGLTRKNIVKAIIETIGCFLPYICYVFASGQFDGFHPFHIAITDEVIASGITAPISSWNLQGIDSLNKGVLQLLKESFNFYNHKRSQTQLGSRAPAEYRALAA